MKYVIIGSGVIGSAIARELVSRKIGDVLVLDKESLPAQHTSGRNSGVIHSGLNQKPGSLKARLCLQGSSMLRRYCRENGVPIEECGTILVANDNDERRRLRELESSAVACGVPGVRIISKDELKEREPFARGLEGLFSPTGAIVASSKLVYALMRDAEYNGAAYQFDTEVTRIGEKEIDTSKGKICFDFLINCGGLHADNLAHTAGLGRGYSVIPFRGDYREVEAKVNGMIYHVPDLRFPFLGVHLTKTVDQKVIAGPTATLSLAGREGYARGFKSRFFLETANSLGFWMWAARTLSSGSQLRQVVHNLKISRDEEAFLADVAQIYTGEVQLKDNYRSGIRPQIVNRGGRLVEDFLIDRSDCQLHILNAVSPGFTASLAFAKYVVDNYATR